MNYSISAILAVFVLVSALFFTSCATKKETPTDLEASLLREGTMTFDVSVRDAEKLPVYIKNLLPKEGKCAFKGNKMSLSIESMLMTAKVFADGDAETFTTDINGERKQVGRSEVAEKMRNSKVKLEETSETKQILGMTATKYTMKIDSAQTPVDFYVVKDAPVGNLYWALPTGTLKGLIVEYAFKNEMATLLLTAKSIDKTPPAASVFE